MNRFVCFLLLASCGHTLSANPTLLSETVWSDGAEDFGGYSGLELSDDGMHFTTITDRGIWVTTGDLVRKDGVITGVTNTQEVSFPRPDGKLGERWADSEGLAIAPDGTIFVSTEGGRHRVFEFPAGAAKAIPLPRHPDFPKLQANSSLEALAIGPDGALYTIPERSGRMTTPFPVYRYKDGAWDIPFRIPRVGEHLVSGADVGPDNQLYILERDFTGIGFKSRVRRFNLDGSGETTILDTSNGTHDNLEGISVWRDPMGHIRITMISDDNFNFFQQTQIVEYQIDD